MRKLLFFHHGTVSVGAGLSALHIVSSIPREVYQIVVVLPCGKGDLKDKFSEMGIRVRTVFTKSCSYTHVNGYNYPLLSLPHFHNIAELMVSRNTLKKVLEEEQADIVVVNSMTLFWMGKYAQKAGARVVCFHRETYCKGYCGMRTNFIKKRLNADFDRIAFLSYYDMRQTGSHNDKYLRITDKVDSALYEKLDKQQCREELDLPTGKLILFTGGISKLKGIKVLLSAVALMKTDARVVILQYSPLKQTQSGIRGIRQKWQRARGEDMSYWADCFIREKGLGERLILRGRTDEVEKYFVACDLVVFPSQEAHQIRPIYEAGVAKCPIIVSDFENTKEFLDEQNGWCVAHNDITGWAAVCDNVLENGKEVFAKVLANYQRVMKTNLISSLSGEIVRLLLDDEGREEK